MIANSETLASNRETATSTAEAWPRRGDQTAYRYQELTLLWRNGENRWEQDFIARDQNVVSTEAIRI